jgi:hypothetical protein
MTVPFFPLYFLIDDFSLLACFFHSLIDNFYPGWGSPIDKVINFREEACLLKGKIDRNVNM